MIDKYKTNARIKKIFKKIEMEMEKYFGKEYTGFRGKEAVDKLLQEKNGFIPNAFIRNDIGWIGLVWGNDNLGLCHIIKRRGSQGVNIDEFLKDIDEVIERGSLKFNRNSNRFEISKNNKTVIISPTMKEEKFNFVVTAFEICKK
ncbi:MAG: hypothetical protein LBG48_03880 [Rickettsiales bacterium]|nr:hypothetical protein [Rickettsiales bacterium]